MLVKKLVVSNGRWICVSNFHPDVFVVLATSSNLVLILKKPDSMVELANAKGGELSFAIGGELNMGPIKLKTSAVLIDLRIKEVGGYNVLPTWLGIQKNGMDTELGNNEKHYILPEPGMSLIASLEASI